MISRNRENIKTNVNTNTSTAETDHSIACAHMYYNVQTWHNDLSIVKLLKGFIDHEWTLVYNLYIHITTTATTVIVIVIVIVV